MADEIQSFKKNQIQELTLLLKNKKEIGCKWVYAKKEGFLNKNGVHFKARLVAKRYTQKERIDYNEVFFPIVKHSSIRILLALVAQFDLELVQLDVKTTLLHSDLEEEIYVSVRWIQGCWKRKLGLQIEEITVWIEAISKAIVQAI